MATVGKNLDLAFGYATGESGWGEPYNKNFATLDVAATGVLDAFMLNSPAGTETEGFACIVGNAPTGSFAAKAGHIAIRYGTAWIFIAPKQGFAYFCAADAKRYIYAATGWIEDSVILSAADKQEIIDAISADITGNINNVLATLVSAG